MIKKPGFWSGLLYSICFLKLFLIQIQLIIYNNSNGFENLKNYFAVISGNYDEFNDKYRRVWANHHIFTKLKGSPDELNELTDKFKLLGKQEDLEFLFDFSSHL